MKYTIKTQDLRKFVSDQGGLDNLPHNLKKAIIIIEEKPIILDAKELQKEEMDSLRDLDMLGAIDMRRIK